MSVTTSTTGGQAGPAGRPRARSTAPRQTKRWIDWVLTTDHKKIGIMYLVLTFVFFMLGGVEALLMRLQLAVPNNTLLSGEHYNELLTMHGTTMIFLFVVPVMAGFGNYFVPLMIGARDMAFPRLNALSFWLLLFGGIVFYVTLFFQPPEAGWWSYPPLSSIQFSPSGGQDAWIFLIHLTGISSLLGAINFYATIVNMRAPGMSWGRLPLFVWAILVYAVLLIIALPVVAAAVTMLLTDRHFGTHFFDPTAHGSPVLWQHLFWFFGHPEVYIMVLPGFGIISEVIPVFSRKPIFGYKAIAASTAVIAFLATLVWAHHMFASPVPIVVLGFFMLSSFLIGVPTGVKIFNWIATLWRGSLVMTAALYFAVGMIAIFLIGGITGIFLAVFPVDWQLNDTYFVVAHFHYTIFGGAVFPIFAGLYYWFPKMTGRLLNERLGKISFWLMFIGFNMTFFVQHALGLSGMPRRIYTYQPGLGWSTYNLISTIGSFILARRHAADDRQRGDRTTSAGALAGPRPVEGQHARVVRALAAAGQQLRRDPARALGRADARHPPPGRARDRGHPEDRRQRAVRAGRRLSGMDASSVSPVRSAPVLAGARQLLADYFELTKPKVQSLLLFTTVTTMEIAGNPSVSKIALTCLGGYLSAGGAGAVNHYYDRDIDAQMKRTASRPIPAGRIVAARGADLRLRPVRAVVPAAVADRQPARRRAGARRVRRLRRRLHDLAQAPHAQNIVIGGAAGAVPPLVGWAATRGSLSWTAVYLFAIVFYWTPPHFWALSLLMKDEYAKVGVPMMPVVRGERETRRQILLYTLLLYAISQLPFCAGEFGGVYLVASMVLGLAFIGGAVLLYRRADRRTALRLYLFSLAYLALLFGAMVADVKL